MVTLNLKPTGVVAVLKDNVKGSIQIELAGRHEAVFVWILNIAAAMRAKVIRSMVI